MLRQKLNYHLATTHYFSQAHLLSQLLYSPTPEGSCSQPGAVPISAQHRAAQPHPTNTPVAPASTCPQPRATLKSSVTASAFRGQRYHRAISH